MALFHEALKVLVDAEGGYVLHKVKHDRGGLTFAGISQRSWPKWEGWPLAIKKPRTPAEEKQVRSMVHDFYEKRYWDKFRGGLLMNQHVAEAIFLHAVVSGVKTAARAVQRALRDPDIKIDGKLGPISRHAVNRMDPELLLLRLAVRKVRRRAMIAHKDKSQLKFLPGWVFRALRHV